MSCTHAGGPAHRLAGHLLRRAAGVSCLVALLAGPGPLRAGAASPPEAAEPEAAPSTTAPPAPTPEPAAIAGRVRYAGRTPLRLKSFDNRLDVEACGARVGSRAVQADRSGHLADVHVEARAADGSPVGPPLRPPDQPLDLTIARCDFDPHVLVVPPGSQVRIHGSDGVLHDVLGLSLRNEPIRARMPRFRRWLIVPAHHFRRTERIRLTCERHNWASGWLLVSDNAAHVVTGADGKYVIDGLPPGTYVVRAWHGEFGARESEIVLSPGETATVDFDFR